MFSNIVIIVLSVIMVGVTAFAVWYENKPESKDTDSDKKDK